MNKLYQPLSEELKRRKLAAKDEMKMQEKEKDSENNYVEKEAPK